MKPIKKSAKASHCLVSDGLTKANHPDRKQHFQLNDQTSKNKRLGGDSRCIYWFEKVIIKVGTGTQTITEQIFYFFFVCRTKLTKVTYKVTPDADRPAIQSTQLSKPGNSELNNELEVVYPKLTVHDGDVIKEKVETQVRMHLYRPINIDIQMLHKCNICVKIINVLK